MKTNLIAMLLATLLLSSCGGGGGGGSSGDGGGGQAVAYAFVPPTLGHSDSYVYNLTDFANGTATYNATDSVVQVNSDGSYVMDWIPAQSSYTLGGYAMGLSGEVDTYNSVGQELEFTPTDQLNFQCNESFSSGALPASLTPGQTFSDTITSQCTGGVPVVQPVTVTFVDVESITVPAGTFNAYKFQEVSSAAVTGETGATETVTTTSWYDTNPARTRMLRRFTQYAFTGFTPSASSILSIDEQLTAYQ